MEAPYDYRNCQSLFGYAESVHKRSGGICQLCGCGGGDAIDFDIWRQFSVEHLIGNSQGGYLKDITRAMAQRFTKLSHETVACLAGQIDEENTVTACSFCNSTTSRDQHSRTMEDLILNTPGDPEQVVERTAAELREILKKKQGIVRWKLHSVRKAFVEHVEPELQKTR